MNWIRPAWPLALLALAALACPASDDTTETGAESGSTPTTTETPTTPTSDDTAGSSESDPPSVCPGMEIVGETTDGATDPLMETWGAPCTTNQDCIDLIGDPEAICDTMAVVYELPGGYCTKPCTLPNAETRFVMDAEDCSPDGGVGCFGVLGMFERCGLFCTDDAQCNRNGYICRQMPLIGLPEDPRSCLMPDCCQNGCES